MNKLFVLLSFVCLTGCSTSRKEPDVSSDQFVDVGSATNTINASYTPSGPGQVGWGGYCCDAWGYRRCILDAYYPLGSGCFCFGQGNGWVCR